MKKTKHILCEAWYFIIALLVAPSAFIHIAYQQWYFKKFLIKKGGQKGLSKEK